MKKVQNTEHTKYRTYKIQNIQNTEHTRYSHFKIQNRKVTEHTTEQLTTEFQVSHLRCCDILPYNVYLNKVLLDISVTNPPTRSVSLTSPAPASRPPSPAATAGTTRPQPPSPRTPSPGRLTPSTASPRRYSQT